MTHGTAATEDRVEPRIRVLPWATVFVTALIFFGAADQVFATRLFSLNFRWAQLLLLVGALACLPFAWQGFRTRRDEVLRTKPLLLAWGVFLAAYATSAIFSDAPGRSLVKLGWGGFNVLGAAAVCLLLPRPKEVLRDAFVAACTLVAAVIWIDALALYWVGLEAPVLGLAQLSYVFEGQQVLRPHAFYYEPSYAGAWLAFGLPVVVLATWHRPLWVRLLLPAVVLGAVVLTSSRTGILGAAVALGVAGLLGLVRRDWSLVRRLTATTLTATVLMAAFFLPPRAAAYGRFIVGPLGPQALFQRLSPRAPVVVAEEVAAPEPPAQPAPAAPAPPIATQIDKLLSGPLQHTSEGYRLASYVAALKTWWQRPMLGWGVIPSASDDQLLPPGTINTWLELLVESGLLGLLTFASAIVVSIRTAAKQARATVLTLLVAAWVAHFLVNLNLTQTFPRLDYWLLFFVTVRLALSDASEASNQATTQPSPDVRAA